MRPSKFFTAGIYLGMAGGLACLIACFITQDTDWLIMYLVFMHIYLTSHHCRKASETNFRLEQLEMVVETMPKHIRATLKGY